MFAALGMAAKIAITPIKWLFKGTAVAAKGLFAAIKGVSKAMGWVKDKASKATGPGVLASFVKSIVELLFTVQFVWY